MATLELRTMPVDQLTPAPYNPRKPLQETAPAYKKLRASLERFGLVEPLIWNETSGHLVGGHLRFRILKELGHTDLPVSVVRLNPAEEKALNVVLNNQEAQGAYDPHKLLEVLGELRELPEFEATGFNDSVFKLLELEPLPEFEPLPESDSVTVHLTTTGEVYERLRGPLDQLIGGEDVEMHIQRG
jgi:ParB-like chromosome segregation protein Spo0J